MISILLKNMTREIKGMRFYTITLGSRTSIGFDAQRKRLSDESIEEDDFNCTLDADFGDSNGLKPFIEHFATEVNTQPAVHVVIDEGMLPKTAEAIRKRIAGDEISRFHAICGKARINLEL